MDKKSSPFDSSRDVTMAADGLEQSVDNRTLFCTPAPVAASTVGRQTDRGWVPVDSKGSFLDDISRLSMQSVSAMDLTNQLKQMNFTTDYSRHERAPMGESAPDLIHFSGATELDSGDQENRSDPMSDVSSRSSMGLIPSDLLSELSRSVLPLATPKADPPRRRPHGETDSSHSVSKERTADSNDWSDNSKQDSKQDSKDMPMGRNLLDTVKKRPQPLDGSRELLRPAARGPLHLFAGHLLGDVQEGEEQDQSVHNVEFGDEDLEQLDIDFSDLEEGRESGDEDFDFDEPMLGLPMRERVERGEEEGNNGASEAQEKTIQAELAEAESRLGEGQESEGEDTGTNQGGNSSNDFGGLDSLYFRKTPMTFSGDGQDAEVATNRSSMASTNQQRGAAEGEHLLTKLRRQFMSADGSENEIDTEDELEAARMSMSTATRERGQGADKEDTDRGNLPLPVGLENDKQSASSTQDSQQKGNQQQHFSLATRRSGEGGTLNSPVRWDGGGGGDGSSGGDSDGGGRKFAAQADRPTSRHISSTTEKQDFQMASGQKVEDSSGLQAKFFLPTSTGSTLRDSGVISSHNLEGSTFIVEDMLQSRTEAPPRSKQGEELRLDASGFNAEDGPENPFEGQFGGSLGSFGLSPDSDHSDMANKSAEVATTDPATGKQETPQFSYQRLSTKYGDSQSQFAERAECLSDKPAYQPQSTNKSSALPGFPGKGSGSFDGPFRKPRAPVLPKKKTDSDKNEAECSLNKELRELGINVDDDDFKPAGAMKAMLDADELQFEEENKFSEHHQLDLAAEGLSWGGEDDQFSGFLAGEDNPASMEMSIGSYMAARTETLGTLGGDPDIPRPEFGKPLQSPPHRRYPVKFMSPPSNASSILSLNSRTEGEGNEDGDKTLVSADSTLSEENLTSPKKSPTSSPAGQEKAGEAATLARTTLANTTAAEVTLSSLLLDLTASNAGGDLSMEDALSMSSVFGFIKNNSYTKSSDFASAMLQLVHAKKRQAKGNVADQTALEQSEVSIKEESKQKSGNTKVVPAGVSGSRADGEAGGSSSSSQSTPCSAASNSPTARKSPRGSRLPVPVGTRSSPVESQPGSRSESSRQGEAVAMALPLSKSKSRSVSHIPSHPEFREADVKHSLDDSCTARKQDVNRKSSDKPKTDVNKRILSQRQSGAPADSSRVSSIKGRPSAGDSVFKVQSGLSSAKPGVAKRKSVNVKSEEDAKVSKNADKLQYAENKDAKDSRRSKSFAPEPSKHLRDIPLNIPPSAKKGKPHAERGMKENFVLEEKNKSNNNLLPAEGAGYAQGTGKDVSQNVPSHTLLQTPPQKLSAASQQSTASSQAREESFSPPSQENALSSQGSPRGTKYNHHVPDGMENSALASGRSRSGGGAKRGQAVGVDDGDLMESRPFDVVDAGGMGQSHPDQGMNVGSQKPSAERQRYQDATPTLLTSSSLLNTEFAKKYINGKDAGVTAPAQSTQPSNPNSTSETTANYVRSVTQTPHPPNATDQTMDESVMSVYYELNEDLQQTMYHSAMGSFWGQSPMYQSTPAFEVGKVAAVSMMASRLHERELTTPGIDLVTPRVQRQLIDVQRNIDFPEICCLGVSQKMCFPVSNRTAFGVVCRFVVVKLVHNGTAVPLDQHSPFELKPKMSLGAGTSESLPVLFVPKWPGEHTCQVEVLSQSLNPSLEPTSTLVQLRAIAEVPHIQISPSVDVLQMGEVMWGGCVVKTIKLRNIKRAALPVRLSIWSASSVWHCFTFDRSSNTSEVSMISMSSRPESLGRSVTTVMLPGCHSPDTAETVEIPVFCRPPNKEMNRALAERPADKIEAKIDVEVDTPVQYLPPLASVLVRATVGMPRLLVPASNMSLAFKTQPNNNIQDSVKLSNAGNISINLTLGVTTFPECFRVSPSRLTIKPGDSTDVAITFTPVEADVCQYRSLLLLDVEPEGPSYEIALEAVVSRPAPVRSSTLNVLASRSYLSFNGVPLNQTKSLTVRLMNKDSSRAEYAFVEVRQSSDCFKLVSASGEWQQSCEVVLEPKARVTLTVIFCPTAVTGYSGKLLLRKQEGHPSKYSIPLVGYGGCSVLALSGACLTNSGHRWLELGSLTAGHNIMREIVLTNSGVRAAFVRASAFFDLMCKQPVPPGRVAVEPNNFVLAAGCSTKVMVAMSPTERETTLVKDRKEVVAVIRFQHGDEVMRQKYQRASERDGAGEQHLLHAAFRQHFTNQTQDAVILEGQAIPDSPNDASAFVQHLSSKCVALLAEPSQPDARTSAMSVSAVLQTSSHTADVSAGLKRERARDRSSHQFREENSRFDSTGQFRVPSVPKTEPEEWTVKPDFLSFTVGENNSKMLQLINFSRQPLRYELSWPPSSVVPEPQKGEIQPRSSTGIEVWLHVAWQKRLADLPWRGEVVISCSGQDKSVRVHIENVPQSSLLALSPHSSPVSLSSISIQSPRDTTLTSTGRSLQLAATSIHFPNAQVNGVHESVLELTNTSMDPVHWNISAFTPAYVKGSDETNTVQRVGYQAFTISPTSADLLPRETVKVPVRFCPRTKGTFNQHWELEHHPLPSRRVSMQDKVTTKISFTAEVSVSSSKDRRSSVKPKWEAVDQGDAPLTSSRPPLEEKHPNTGHTKSGERNSDLQLMSEEVTFSSTKVGQVTQVKVELKNSLDHNMELEVEAPKPPFRVKHKTFKITKMRFLKYPIEFAPMAKGTFEDTMVFKAPALAKTFKLRLKGTTL
ncbi:centrosomal protein of 192 kDa-like isoform X2 [Littorina saxatilis]|uniref:centrosomal protein of 192 kDa-like isoform X2 n=1 Tax=Littorina saxatilis TaxID=31220 RepID=UPI0038B567D0